MANSEPFLQVGSEDNVCALCDTAVILRSEKRYKSARKYKDDLATVKQHAEKWKDLDIPSTDSLACFSSASARLTSRTNGWFHESCLTNIRLKQKAYASKYEIRNTLNEPLRIEVPQQASSDTGIVSPSYCTRSSLTSPTEKHQCFVCENDSETFRISQKTVAQKVLHAKSIHLNKFNSLYFSADKRLNLMLEGGDIDIFAADV